MKKHLFVLFFAILLISTQNILPQNRINSIDNIPELLPQKKDSFIEEDKKPSGFSIRGIKGWSWTPKQYLEEIPILAKYKMNFLMNCYLSMFSQPLIANTNIKWDNEWWLPIPPAKKKAYEKVFEKCRKYGITFCFSLNPQLASPRPLKLKSNKDFDNIWQKYSWAQNNGVRWFCVSLDDVSGVKISGKLQSEFVNKLLARLRKKDPGAQMIFCPTYYYGDGTSAKQKPYLEQLARYLDSSVYVFWTGPGVRSAQITVNDAETFKSIVKHKVILWDNFPVNNQSVTIHLEPVSGRAKDLYKVIDGYMSNPLFSENEINRIPLFTIADYTYDPQDYNPEKSIGQAIIHQTNNKTQQQVLLEMVKLFSGKIGNPAFNAVVYHFNRITGIPYSRYLADLYISYLKKVQKDFNNKFPKKYNATKIMFAKTIKAVENIYHNKYGAAFAMITQK